MTENRAGVADFFRRFGTFAKAELHLHLEGAVAPATLVKLSARCGGVFPDAEAVHRRRRGVRDAAGFFLLYRDACRLLRSASDYALVASDLVRRLRRENIGYAEVYVSPAVVERLGLDWPSVASALECVFAEHERRGGRVAVLLDSVRHWGPDAAHRVLDLHESDPWPRVVGFGLGGDELAVPAKEFAGVYRRVRRLGLAPLVHAGEWGGPDSIASALTHLRPVRIAHGIRATEDPALVRLLARRGIALDVCPTSNRATGALPLGRRHPIRDLLRAGVKVTLATDDPGLFGTTLRREYRQLARLGAGPAELRAVLLFSRSAALGSLRR